MISSLNVSIFDAIESFFVSLAQFLDYEYLLYTLTGLLIVFILFTFIKTRFSYEVRAIRAFKRINAYFLKKPYVNDSNLAEFNKKMKKIPYQLRERWQLFMLNRDGLPSTYMTLYHCVEQPIKTSTYHSTIKFMQYMTIIIVAIGVALGLLVATSSTLSTTLLFRAFLAPLLFYILAQLYVFFLDARFNALSIDLYEYFLIFTRNLDKASSSIPDYVDYELLFTNKEISEGIPILKEYLEKKALMEKIALEKAKANMEEREKFDFDSLGIDGSLVLERAMETSQDFLNNRRRLMEEVTKLETDKNSYNDQYIKVEKDGQKKLQAIKENLERFQNQLEASATKIESNYIKKQQAEEKKKREVIEKDLEDLRVKFAQEMQFIDSEIAKRMAEIDKSKAEVSASMDAEFETYADKVYTKILNKFDEDNSDELHNARNNLEDLSEKLDRSAQTNDNNKLELELKQQEIDTLNTSIEFLNEKLDRLTLKDKRKINEIFDNNKKLVKTNVEQQSEIEELNKKIEELNNNLIEAQNQVILNNDNANFASENLTNNEEKEEQGPVYYDEYGSVVDFSKYLDEDGTYKEFPIVFDAQGNQFNFADYYDKYGNPLQPEEVKDDQLESNQQLEDNQPQYDQANNQDNEVSSDNEYQENPNQEMQVEQNQDENPQNQETQVEQAEEVIQPEQASEETQSSEVQYYDENGNVVDFAQFYNDDGTFKEFPKVFDADGNYYDFADYYDIYGNPKEVQQNQDQDELQNSQDERVLENQPENEQNINDNIDASVNNDNSVEEIKQETKNDDNKIDENVNNTEMISEPEDDEEDIEDNSEVVDDDKPYYDENGNVIFYDASGNPLDLSRFRENDKIDIQSFDNENLAKPVEIDDIEKEELNQSINTVDNNEKNSEEDKNEALFNSDNELLINNVNDISNDESVENDKKLDIKNEELSVNNDNEANINIDEINEKIIDSQDKVDENQENLNQELFVNKENPNNLKAEKSEIENGLENEIKQENTWINKPLFDKDGEVVYYDERGNLVDFDEFYADDGTLKILPKLYDGNGVFYDFSKYYDINGNLINQNRKEDKKATSNNSLTEKINDISKENITNEQKEETKSKAIETNNKTKSKQKLSKQDAIISTNKEEKRNVVKKKKMSNIDDVKPKTDKKKMVKTKSKGTKAQLLKAKQKKNNIAKKHKIESINKQNAVLDNQNAKVTPDIVAVKEDMTLKNETKNETKTKSSISKNKELIKKNEPKKAKMSKKANNKKSSKVTKKASENKPKSTKKQASKKIANVIKDKKQITKAKNENKKQEILLEPNEKIIKEVELKKTDDLNNIQDQINNLEKNQKVLKTQISKTLTELATKPNDEKDLSEIREIMVNLKQQAQEAKQNGRSKEELKEINKSLAELLKVMANKMNK